jgi:hypothetical protein
MCLLLATREIFRIWIDRDGVDLSINDLAAHADNMEFGNP